MSERVHMTAPDGRTFTFKEWCEYLKQPGHDVDSEYVGADGKVFEVGGFRFNVHGHCLNAHKIMVGDHEVGFELRTYRKWVSLKDRREVWVRIPPSISNGQGNERKGLDTGRD